MSERTKRTGAIVAVLACVLMVGLLGYWLGRGNAPQPKPQTTAQPATAASSAVSGRAAPPGSPKPHEASTVKASAKVVFASSIPLKWRFAGISQYHIGNDTESWLSQFADHNDLIARFNQRYPYAWNVSSPDEIAWLARNGFPMPEDVIAADAMSDDDLRSAADAGSGKAVMFYFERLRDEWIAAGRAEMANGAALSEVTQRLLVSMPDNALETTRIGLQLRQLDTPFFGYMEATRPFLGDDEIMRAQNFASGLALAFARGDDRAAMSILAGSSNGQLSEEQASLVYRIVTEMRDLYPAYCAREPKLAAPFPAVSY